MSKIYGSDTDMALRVLLLLSEFRKPLSLDRMVSYDFIITYGANFGFAKENLHGDNEYSFGELAVRRRAMTRSIRYLITHGLITEVDSEDGFSYVIADMGRDAVKKLHSVYAQSYREISMRVFDEWGESSDYELRSRIDHCQSDGSGNRRKG